MNTTHTSGQLIKFLELLAQKGCVPDLFQGRLGHGILADIFNPNAVMPDRDELRKLFRLGPLVPEVITLPVDYSMTLEDMIKAGNYDWKNDGPEREKLPCER